MTPSELTKVAEFLGLSDIAPLLPGTWEMSRKVRIIGMDEKTASRLWTDADLLLALLEKLAEKGHRPSLMDRRYVVPPLRRYTVLVSLNGSYSNAAGPTWLDAVVAAVLEVVK